MLNDIQVPGRGPGRRTLMTGLGAGLLGAAASRTRAWAEDPVKIGWVRPTTGPLASSFAPLFTNGLIAIDEINAAGGIMGRPILRVELDDEASPAKEPAAIRQLQDQGVGIVCGPAGSSQTLAALAVTNRAKLIHVSYAFGADLADGTRYPYHYQLSFNSDMQAAATVHHLVEVAKVTKIGILQENTAYGESITAATRALLKQAGLQPVALEVYPLTTLDMSANISNLRKAGAEAVIGWISTLPAAAIAFNAMNAANWHPIVAGQTTLFSESLINLVPPDALANVYGTYYKAFTWTDTESPGDRQVGFAEKIAKYPEAKNSEVSVAASPFYDFMYLLKAVVEDQKSFDNEKIKRALDNVKDFPGMAAKLNLSPTNHCAIASTEMVMASVSSAHDPKAMGIFRKRAQG